MYREWAILSIVAAHPFARAGVSSAIYRPNLDDGTGPLQLVVDYRGRIVQERRYARACLRRRPGPVRRELGDLPAFALQRGFETGDFGVADVRLLQSEEHTSELQSPCNLV